MPTKSSKRNVLKKNVMKWWGSGDWPGLEWKVKSKERRNISTVPLSSKLELGLAQTGKPSCIMTVKWQQNKPKLNSSSFLTSLPMMRLSMKSPNHTHTGINLHCLLQSLWMKLTLLIWLNQPSMDSDPQLAYREFNWIESNIRMKSSQLPKKRRRTLHYPKSPPIIPLWNQCYPLTSRKRWLRSSQDISKLVLLIHSYPWETSIMWTQKQQPSAWKIKWWRSNKKRLSKR